MTSARWIRGATAIILSFAGITAIAGGAVLVAGSIIGRPMMLLIPDSSYLDGSPFGSFLVPGLLLAVVVGGMQLTALAFLVRKPVWAPLATSIAAYAMIIWIFVQMIFIPFSFLQLVYFALGLAEIGLVLLAAGMLPSEAVARTGERPPAHADKHSLL